MADLEEQTARDMDEAETRAKAQSIKDRITGKAGSGKVTVDEDLASDENNPLTESA